MTTWLTDGDGNKCSVEYFGSHEAAQKALDSLTDCDNCTNCTDCSFCSDCSGCSGCSDCSYCSDCSSCSYCSYCSDCSGCSDCSDCSSCSRCSDCSRKVGVKSETGDFTPPTVPKIENIHQRVFEAVSKPNALDMGDWHTCNTTHCRAGWVVHLAGEAGYELERFHNTALAAQLIYRESGYEINPGKFYVGNAEALADMAKLSGVEPPRPQQPEDNGGNG